MFNFPLSNYPKLKILAQNFHCAIRTVTEVGGEVGKQSILRQNSLSDLLSCVSCMAVKDYCGNCNVSFFVRLPCLFDLTVLHVEFGYRGNMLKCGATIRD